MSLRRTHHRSTTFAAAGTVALALVAGVAGVVGMPDLGRSASGHPPIQHPVAPGFTRPLASLKGGTFSLSGQRGHPVLLSFLNTQAEASTANDASRAQVPFLKSMDTQNRPHGLRTVIVDAAASSGMPPAGRNALINFTFDWALRPSIAVVGDKDGSLARAYRVRKAPTTFLIDRHGFIRRRWTGVALTAQLDFAIRPLVGRTVFESSSQKRSLKGRSPQ